MGLASGGGPAPGGLTADVQPNACVCPHHTCTHGHTQEHIGMHACCMHTHLCATHRHEQGHQQCTHTHAHTDAHEHPDTGVDHPAPEAEGSSPRSPKCTSHCPALRLCQGNESSRHSSPGARLVGEAGGVSASPGGSPLPWCLPAAPSTHSLALSLGPWLLSLG